MKLAKLGRKQTIGLAVGVGIAAVATPFIVGYIRSLPKNLSIEEAGKRYLAIVCPSNRTGDSLNRLTDQRNEMVRKYNRDAQVLYYDQASLDKAAERLRELGKEIEAKDKEEKKAALEYGKILVTQSRELADPHYVWPQEVRSNIAEMSKQDFARGGDIIQRVRGTESAPNNALRDQEENETADNASEIRRKLNLASRGECPAEAKAPKANP